MKNSRRDFIKKSITAGVAASFLASRTLSAAETYKKGEIKIGYMAPGTDKLDHFEYAKLAGFDGVEMQSPYKDGVFKVFADKAQLDECKRLSAEFGMPICSACAGAFNNNPFISDEHAISAAKQCIDACAYWGAKDLLVAFFVKGRLNDEDGQPVNEEKFKAVVERLKILAPYAEEKGVCVCIENTLNAKDNMRIIDAVGSSNVRMYYDIANSHRYGYDVPSEIRQLGLKYIRRIHFKDNVGRFNSKDPDVDACIAAVKDIGYKGWIVLERNFENNTPTSYWRHNMEYIRKAFGA